MDILALAMAKDYTDKQRLGGIEKHTEVVFSDIAVTTVPMEEIGGLNAGIVTASFSVEKIIGVDKAKVILNGTAYICPAQIDAGIVQFGNFAYNGEEDTGEPFFISFSLEDGAGFLITQNPGDYTFSASVEYEEIIQIPREYIPNIPHIELETRLVDGANIGSLITEDCAKLSDLLMAKVDTVRISFSIKRGDYEEYYDLVFYRSYKSIDGYIIEGYTTFLLEQDCRAFILTFINSNYYYISLSNS